MSTSRLKSAALFGAAAFGLTAFGGDYIWSGGTSGSWSGENSWTQNEASSENYVINTADAEVAVSGDVSIANGLYVEAANVVVAGNNYQEAVEATEETEGSEAVAASNLTLGWLHVGAWGGSGDLTFRDGNVVANGLNVANAGNNGTLIIDGANVTDNSWTRFGDWNAKSAGTAELVIQNGGKLTVWQIQSYLNGNSTVTLDNGTLAYHQNANGAPILGNTTQTGADTIYGEDGSTWQPVEQKVVIGTGGGTIEVPADTTVTVNAAVSGNGTLYKKGAGELTFKSGVLGNGVNVNVLAGSATFNGTYATTGDFIVGSTASASAYIAGNVTCAPGKWTLLGNWSNGSACDATITVGPGAVFATDHFQRAGNVNSATVTLKGGTLKATGGWFLTEWESNAPVDLYVDAAGGTIACEATTTTEEEGEDPVTTPVDVTVASKITGAGTLTWTGAGTLYVTGDITGFTGSFARAEGAGEIVISQEPVATIGSTNYYNVDTALAAAVAAATAENHVEVTLLASTTLTADSAKTFDNVTVALADGVELSFTNVAPFSGSYNADTKTLAFVRNAAEYVYVGNHASATTAAGSRPGVSELTSAANFTINGVASTVAPAAGDTIVIDQPTYMRISSTVTVAAAIRLDALLDINGNTSKWLYVSDISGDGKLVLSGGNRIATSGGAVTISCPVEIASTDVLLQADEGKEFTLKGALSGTGTLTLSRPRNGSGYTGTKLACSDASQFKGTIIVAQADDNVGRNCASFASTCDLSNASVEWKKNTTAVTQTFLYDQNNQSESKTWKFGSLSGEMYPGANGAANKHPNIEVGALGKDDTLKGYWINYGSSRQPNVKKVGTGTLDVSEMTNANSYTLAGGTLVVSAEDKDIVSKDSSITTAALVCTPDDEENPTTYTFTLHYYTAMIGETGYDTVKDALEAAKAGETVKLTANVTETVRYANANDITLDLNGYTLTSDGVATLCNNGTGTLTITGDGSIVNTADAEDQGIAVWARIGSIVINGGTFVNQSTYEGTVYVGAGTAKEANATITINGGTFKNIAEGTYHWNGELAPRVLNVWNSYDVSALKVYGGAFGVDPTTGDDVLGSSFIPEGYDCYFAYDEETGLYTVATGVAKVGDTWYPSFLAAYEAAGSINNPTMTVKIDGDFTPAGITFNKAFYKLEFVSLTEEPITIDLTDGTYLMQAYRLKFPENATLNAVSYPAVDVEGGTLNIPEGVSWRWYLGKFAVTALTGEGSLVVGGISNVSSLSGIQTFLQNAEDWNGTLEIVDSTITAVWNPAQYANENASICFNGVTTYLYSGTQTLKGVVIGANGLTVNGGYSSGTFAFNAALSGTGTITAGMQNTASGTQAIKVLQFTGDLTGFAGNVAFADDSNVCVVFGSTVSDTKAYQVVLASDAEMTVAADHVWTANDFVMHGKLTVNGNLVDRDGEEGAAGVVWNNQSGAVLTVNKEGSCKLGNTSNWRGTYGVGWSPANQFIANNYGNQHTTVAMTADFGEGGYFFRSSGRSVELYPTIKIAADVTIKGRYSPTDISSGWDSAANDIGLTKFNKLTGDHTLTFADCSNGNGCWYRIVVLDNYTGSLVLQRNDRVKIDTVNVASAPEEGACVVKVTVPSNAVLAEGTALTVAGEAYGTLEYRAADGDNPAGLYLVAGGLDPNDPASAYESTAETEEAAIEEAAANVVEPFKGEYFSYKTAGEAGAWTVTIDGFAEGLVEDVLADALVFDAEGKASVTVPAGLYYLITTHATLGGEAVATVQGQSDGTALEIAKPGTEQGFIDVKIGTAVISAETTVVVDGENVTEETTPGDGSDQV